MKKIASIAICALIFINVSAQTKPKHTLEETVNWIVEKLNNTSTNYRLIKDQTIMKWMNYEFSFNKEISKESININYQFRPLQGGMPVPQLNTDYKVIIPLKDIKSIEYVEDNIDVFNPTNSAKNTLLRINTYSKSISLQTDNKPITMDNFQDFPLDFKSEDNLLQRMQKAFSDLKSFFPKKQEAY